MKLVALLSWYDEPVWCLAELVASLAGAGCDSLVAVDGAYLDYPEGRAQSPGEQAQAILAAGQGAGLEVTLHAPREPWVGNEIEKRSFLFQLGHLVATPGEDWLWVVDADERITESLGLRDALERTEHPTASVLLEPTYDGSREGLTPARRLFRAHPYGIHLEHNHFTYVSGTGELLYEGHQPGKPHLVECEHLAFVRMDHRGGRSQLRQHHAQVYYDRRKERGLELVPG